MTSTKTENLTFTEALRALLDGKTVADPYDNRIKLVGDKLYLDMRACMFDDTDGPFSIVEPKNEETPGTFAWARREVELGRAVGRCGMHGAWTKEFFSRALFGLEDIDATDWTNA